MFLSNFSADSVPSLPSVPGFEWILLGFFIVWILLGLLVGFGMGLLASIYINGSYLMMFFLTLGLQPYIEAPFAKFASGIFKIGTGDPNDFISGTINNLIYLLIMFLFVVIIGTTVMVLIFLIFFRKWFKAVRRKAKKGYKITSRISGALIGATVSMASFTYVNNISYVAVGNYKSNVVFDGLRKFYGNIPLIGSAEEIKNTLSVATDLPKQLAGITDLAGWINNVKDTQNGNGGTPQTPEQLKEKSKEIATALSGITAPGGLLDNQFLRGQLLNSPELKGKLTDSLTQQLSGLSLDSIKGTSIPTEFLDPSLKDQVVNNKDKLLGLFKDVLGDKFSESSPTGSIQEKLEGLFGKFSSTKPSIANVAATATITKAPIIDNLKFAINPSQQSTWDNFADTPIQYGNPPSFMTISIASNINNKPLNWELVIYSGDYNSTAALADNEQAFKTNYASSQTAFATWKTNLETSWTNGNASNIIYTPTGSQSKPLTDRKVISFPAIPEKPAGSLNTKPDNLITGNAYTFKLEYWKLEGVAFVKDSHENSWTQTNL